MDQEKLSREYIEGYEDCTDKIIQIIKKCKTIEDVVTYSYLLKGEIWEMKRQLEAFEATIPNHFDEEACAFEDESGNPIDEFVIDLGDGRQLVISMQEGE